MELLCLHDLMCLTMKGNSQFLIKNIVGNIVKLWIWCTLEMCNDVPDGDRVIYCRGKKNDNSDIFFIEWSSMWREIYGGMNMKLV